MDSCTHTPEMFFFGGVAGEMGWWVGVVGRLGIDPTAYCCVGTSNIFYRPEGSEMCE